MADLFDASLPPYGSLNSHQERKLYDIDRQRWFAYVAKATALKLTLGGAESISIAWPLMSNEYKKAIWPHMDEEIRDIVRLMRATRIENKPE